MARKKTTYERKAPADKRVAEAAVAYQVTSAPERDVTMATTRLSSKNQITIPVAMCRLMDMRPGDEIELMVMGDTVYMQRLPRTPEEWARRFDNSPATIPEWSSKEKIDAWIRAERDSWDNETAD